MFFRRKKTKPEENFSPQDKIEILGKLRDKYRRAAAEYGARFFDLAKLEQRIMLQQQTQSDFQRFILDEMEFFKTMQAKAAEERERQRRKQELDARLREIMEANDALIAHYPDVIFHPLASYECRKIVGAISNLFPAIREDLRFVFQGRRQWQAMQFHLADLERFYCQPGQLTAFLSAYINELTQRGEAGRDDADRKFLQTAAICLAALSNQIAEGLPELSEHDARRASQAKAKLDAIISDFRMADWAQYALSRQKKK
ncbi:MAG: hypothetical protein N2Z22_01775 [Turneriella sp.]|nr:hypothetical protein [Turneriella sp.]